PRANAPGRDGAVVGCGCERHAVGAEAGGFDVSARLPGQRPRSTGLQVEKCDAAVGVTERHLILGRRKRRSTAEPDRLHGPQGACIEEERSSGAFGDEKEAAVTRIAGKPPGRNRPGGRALAASPRVTQDDHLVGWTYHPGHGLA